ncbi:nitrilase-related carbon-nitrogen hydrolase [Spirobacillus cienkowskii]|uniref:nitrilase-related carbon-nitrogen hydrolase n=1 Tax=Spirobacillus cienkowskii TaxID=495820 RepID=UPI0030D4C9DB
MLISCIQVNPQENVRENLKVIINYIFEAAKLGSEIVVLPEMFTFMGNELDRKKTKDQINEGVFAEVQAVAKQLNIYLIAGSHSEKIQNNENKVYNTSVTYNPEGEIINVYRKQHLFNLKDKEGKSLYCESDTFEFGSSPIPYFMKTKNNQEWNALNIICYDLRFPEIVRSQAEKFTNNFDIIFVPAAFTWQTGKEHWEILLRARAIENQCYVVACNQTGYFYNQQKRNYGHSMVVDPWGNIVARLEEECGILSCEITKETIELSRTRLPALQDRKIFG